MVLHAYGTKYDCEGMLLKWGGASGNLGFHCQFWSSYSSTLSYSLSKRRRLVYLSWYGDLEQSRLGSTVYTSPDEDAEEALALVFVRARARTTSISTGEDLSESHAGTTPTRNFRRCRPRRDLVGYAHDWPRLTH